jgi:hypothetical protein
MRNTCIYAENGCVAKSPRGAPAAGRQSRAVMETVEPRVLAAVSQWLSSTINEVTGYSMMAEILFGDNGNPYGVEGMTMSNATEYQGSVVTWDSDLSDGLDSGWIGVELIAAAGASGAQWNVDGIGSLQTGDGGFAEIGKVTVRAVVTRGGLAMCWRDLRVQFYSGGQLVESMNLGDTPCADTLGVPNSGPLEAGREITPSGADGDPVGVMGMIRLRAVAGNYPGVTDIFSQILITQAS